MIKQNDHDFFVENVLPHQDSINRLIIHLSQGDVQLANEITQDTMCAALDYIKKVRTVDNIKAYLHTIAKNKFSKHRKKYREWIPIDEIADEIDTGEIIADVITELETAEELKEKLSLLDKKYSQVLHLHYYENLSLVEIARLYGISHNTVYSWHTRALKKLEELCTENEER